MIALPDRNLYFRCSFCMFRVQATHEMACPMNRQVDLLPHAHLLAGQSHNKKGAKRIDSVVPSWLVTIALLAVERLPRKREAQFRSSCQSRLLADHLLDCP